MKKKLLSALLCLVLALTLLPTAALAAPTRLKSVDLVIDLPKAGDPNEMETEVTIKSMKSGNIDLLANGAGILYTEWQGDDVETDDGYAFRAGTTYLVNIKLAFDTTKGYCANYKTVGGENIVGPDTFSATVNGVPWRDLSNSQQINAGLAVIDVIGQQYGVTPPIFIDNAESVSEIRPTKAQQIRLIVSPALRSTASGQPGHLQG